MKTLWQTFFCLYLVPLWNDAGAGRWNLTIFGAKCIFSNKQKTHNVLIENIMHVFSMQQTRLEIQNKEIKQRLFNLHLYL